jgi:hypothetical protein
MKSFLLLAAAFVLTTSATLAQTVVPGSSVPGPVVPGTLPNGQTGIPTSVSSAGSPRAKSNSQKVANLDRKDKKMMRKMGKVKYKSDATKTEQ